MQVDFGTLLTVVSVFFAVYFAAKNNNRQQDADVSYRASETAMISQKLDNINDDTKEIKKELTDVKRNVSELSERVIIVEQSTKSAHHRIDDMEGYDESGRKIRRRRRQ